MTVRQVFYQLAVQQIVPKDDSGYDVVQRQVLDLRRSGVLPYEWIADSTRWQRKPTTYTSAREAIDYTAKCYRQAIWENQNAYVEVWCEKDALASIIYQETSPYDVPLMVSRGFSSDSFLFEAAEAIKSAGRPAFLYYFGDRDPSGVRIDPAIRAGLNRLAPDADITFERASITPEQVEEWNLPTRPTKRANNAHAKRFEGESVELDALPSWRLRDLVRKCIERHIDLHAFEITKLAERHERELFARVLQSIGA